MGVQAPGPEEDDVDERSSGRPDRRPTGVLRAASEELFERVQSFTEAVRRLGAEAVGELPAPLPAAGAELLRSVRAVVESVPAPTAPLDMMMEEIKAKRAIVRALQEQLSSFETQLEVLERSLVPLHEWSRQWEHVQSALLDPLRRRGD
jgi:hypothetical protein